MIDCSSQLALRIGDKRKGAGIAGTGSPAAPPTPLDKAEANGRQAVNHVLQSRDCCTASRKLIYSASGFSCPPRCGVTTVSCSEMRPAAGEVSPGQRAATR